VIELGESPQPVRALADAHHPRSLDEWAKLFRENFRSPAADRARFRFRRVPPGRITGGVRSAVVAKNPPWMGEKARRA
jgi:hypothetical protein